MLRAYVTVFIIFLAYEAKYHLLKIVTLIGACPPT